MVPSDNGFVFVLVHVDDELAQMRISPIVGLIAHHKEKIKTRHDGWGYVEVMLEGFGLVVTSKLRVSCC